jgi:transcriptional regulator CtsR
MKNLRVILLQIIDVLDLPPWKDGEVDNFLAFAQVGAMVELIEGLPRDKQEPMLNQIMFKSPREVEQLFGRYYTEKQMQEAVITRTKKSIMKDVVEPHRKELTLAQRDSILALLNKLTY